MPFPPGTVSKILWHFTGGPKWDGTSKCQQDSPKPASEAYEALRAILQSKQLCLGKYREVATVRVPTRRWPATLIEDKRPDFYDVQYQSCPVCCVSDIPVAHLSYHAERYGKIAIGFHRESAIRAGFNPVFYSLRESVVLRSLHDGFAKLGEFARQNFSGADDVVRIVERLECKEGHTVDLSDARDDVESAVDEIREAVERATNRLEYLLAFVKTFANDEFSTIYCEREWRSTNPFGFTVDDVAMIVLPKAVENRRYFDEFVSGSSEGLPRSIPIVPWEDLIEH